MTHLDRNQLFVVLLISASILQLAVTEILVSPEDVEAELGASVAFNCSSSISGYSIQWNIYPIGKGMEVIYAYGKVNTQYGDRFTVQDGTNLLISSVTLDDAGTYQCQDDFGHGEKRGAELILIATNPICQSNSNLNTFLGNNTWGIEPSQVTLSCSVQYQGYKPPTLEWKKHGDDKTISSGVSSEIRGNRVLYNLTMKGDSITDGSSYNCRPAKAASASATCNSGKITIIGECTSSSMCQSESRPNYIAVIVGFGVLVMVGLTSFGLWYLYVKVLQKRKRERDIRNHEEWVFSHEKAGHKTKMREMNIGDRKLHENLKDLETQLFHRERIEYPKKPLLTDEIKMHEKKSIKGLAVLEGKVFVLLENCSEIEVYSAETYQSEPQIHIPEIIEPFDLACLKDDKCLFIVGNKPTETSENSSSNKVNVLRKISEIENSVIVKLDMEGTLLTQWQVKSGRRRCHLSTYESNLVVLLCGSNLILEFSRDGELKCKVDLASRNITSTHAIKVTSMHFTVSSIDADSDVFTLMVVDHDAEIKKEYKVKEDGMSCHFIADGENSYLVADKVKKRISLFNSSLKFCRHLIEFKDGEKPVRLCLDQDRSRLFVATEKADENKSLNSIVKIYDIKQKR